MHRLRSLPVSLRFRSAIGRKAIGRSGQTLVEYTLILAVISILALSGLQRAGQQGDRGGFQRDNEPAGHGAGAVDSPRFSGLSS